MNDENIPSTTMVFDRPQLVFDEHDWMQQGYMVSDVCNPAKVSCHAVGIPIPSGKLLVKDEKGHYDLIDEKRG